MQTITELSTPSCEKIILGVVNGDNQPTDLIWFSEGDKPRKLKKREIVSQLRIERAFCPQPIY